MTHPQNPHQQPQQWGTPHQGHYPQYQQAPPPKKRRIWPWVLLAVVLIPVVFFVACTAMVGGAVNAVNDARQGGTVNIGETFTYQSGLAITVAAPAVYKPKNQFEVGDGFEAFEAPITVTNGTQAPVGVALFTKNATVNGQPAQEVFGEATFATQDIAPGQSLTLPFRFKVAEGTRGPLQISVRDTFNEPVFFTGQL